ncbi:hypothetical protein [Bordetella genomosp. 1]|uniref:hypothetical protein n=1 Tax=Bordetella genomosp. 1 TaxID=1395607 RepID=UPI001140C0A5|nr:hypothetical protein [Bordetella genomosp. 1]
MLARSDKHPVSCSHILRNNRDLRDEACVYYCARHELWEDKSMRTALIFIGAAVVAFFLVKGIKAYFAERNGKGR